MRKIALTLCLVLCGYALFAQETIKLRINPDDARGANVSDLFDSVRYIPLETTKESIFNQIDDMVISDQYFIILDRWAKRILLFDKNGKYRCSIRLKSNGYINTFRYNPVSRLVEVVGHGFGNIQLFNLDGIYQGEGALTGSMGEWYFDSATVAYTNYDVREENKDSANFEVYVMSNGKRTAEGLPYNMQTSHPKSSDIISVNRRINGRMNDTIINFIRPYDYTIYGVTPHTFFPRYQIMLPLQYTLSADFRKDSLFKPYKGLQQRQLYEQNHKYEISCLDYTLQWGNNLLFKLNNYENNRSHYYIYGLKSASLYDISKISPDSSCYFLPATDLNSGVVLANNGFYNDGTHLYTSISSIEFLSEKALVDARNIEYPLYLKNYFKTMDKTDNPIIVELTLKDNL